MNFKYREGEFFVIIKIINSFLLLLFILSFSSCVKMKANIEYEVYFNHTYFTAANKDFFKKLKEAGFYIVESTKEHPGSIESHFIAIGDEIPHAEKYSSTKPYLEFAIVKSLPEYEKQYNAGEKNKKTLQELMSYKGYSLSSNIALDKVKEKFLTDAKYVHKNYDWQKKREIARVEFFNI